MEGCCWRTEGIPCCAQQQPISCENTLLIHTCYVTSVCVRVCVRVWRGGFDSTRHPYIACFSCCWRFSVNYRREKQFPPFSQVGPGVATDQTDIRQFPRRWVELRSRKHAHLSGFMELLLQPRDRHHCGCGDQNPPKKKTTPRPGLDTHRRRQSGRRDRPLFQQKRKKGRG